MRPSSILALALLVPLLASPALGAPADDPRPIVPASEILAKIERGEPVEYDGVIVVGDLDLSGLNLTIKHVERSEEEIEDMGLTEDVIVVESLINIEESEIRGNINLSNVIFQNSVNFEDTYFTEEAQFSGSNFSFGDTNFGWAVFSDGDADFEGAKFSGGDAYFWGAKFNGGEADFEGAKFSGGDAYFWRAEFNGGGADFRKAEFSGGDAIFLVAKFSGGYGDFNNAEFSGGYADFKNAMFNNGGAYFWKTEFSGGDANFEGANFSDGDAYFYKAEFSGGGANFAEAFFSEGDVIFEGAKFNGGSADFSTTEFSDCDANFVEVEFSGGDANFEGAVFSGGEADFEEAEFDGVDANFRNAKFNSNNAVFWRTKFNGYANFKDSEFRFCHFDLRETDFSEITTFENSEFMYTDLILEDAKIYILQLSNANFYNGAAISLKGTNYQKLYVHWDSIKDVLIYNGEVYLTLVKNFRNIEYFEDADNCYYKYRRERQSMRSWWEASKYIDILAWLTCGYGILPGYTLGWCLVLISFFGLVFWAGNGIYKINTPNQNNAIWKAEKEWGFSSIFNTIYYKAYIRILAAPAILRKVLSALLKIRPRTLRCIPGRIWNASFVTEISFKDALYFSTMVFVSMPPHDWRPKEGWKYWVMLEDVLGWLLLALFLVTLGNVMIR